MRRLTGYLLPQDAPVWEAWCCHIFAEVRGYETALPFSDPGKKQFGIDLIATRSDGKTVAVQCKLISNGDDLAEDKAEDDLAKTDGLSVELELLMFATTSKCHCLQEWAALKNQSRPAKNVKQIGIMSWPDFIALFNLHDHLVRKIYPHLLIQTGDGKEQEYAIFQVRVPKRDSSMLGEVQLKLMHILTAHPGTSIEARESSTNQEEVRLSYSNLAHIAIAEGNIPEAVTLWRRAYAICLKALGPDHPYTKDDAAILRKYDPPGP